MSDQPPSAPATARSAVQQLAVGAGQAGQRLDNFLLSRLKGAPKTLIYRIIRKGEVRINGKRAKPESRLELGDVVRVPPLRLASRGDKPRPGKALQEHLRQAVLYQDQDLLVLNKPSGLPVHAGTGSKLGVIESLRAIYPEYPDLELVHRLDKGTSGCLLLALNAPARRKLMDAFREQQVHKRYLLLVAGHWPGWLQVVNKALQRQPERGGERRVQTDAAGKAALTRFTVLQHFADSTLLEAEPATGRTHQIRVHASASGFPLLGDDKYYTEGSRELSRRLGIKRLALHAAALSFPHPVSGQVMEVSAPPDPDWQALLATLAAAD